LKTDNNISQSAIYNFIKACEEHSNINPINLVLLQGDDVLEQFCKKPYGFQFHIMQNGCYRADGAFRRTGLN